MQIFILSNFLHIDISHISHILNYTNLIPFSLFRRNVVCNQVQHDYTVLQTFTRIAYENYKTCCEKESVQYWRRFRRSRAQPTQKPPVRLRRWGKKKRNVEALNKENGHYDDKACTLFCSKSR